ncbi:hypothetical protein EV645_6724 [Kribbella rubisoli]|uniref:Uncharacterized protein n=1 Tax=Kribbella rubisoli TaxID=3075929 RepID=A0A4Q7WJF1_9ACTN|nr:hypothetical protein [Kribbella rubisoli]RZU10262.1 hypothetical protein EV645_6724 [Kribbella rubisoli]
MVKQLGADDVLASNTLSHPDAVVLRDLGVLDLPEPSYEFPARSITLLSFAVSG